MSANIPLSAEERLRARVVERCERCRTERAVGSTTACRCSEPAWKLFCTRCVRAFDGNAANGANLANSNLASANLANSILANSNLARANLAGLCPNCVEIARTNGAQLRTALDTRLVRESGLAGAVAAAARRETRATDLLREFGLASVVPPLPDFARRLADPATPLPPGASSSRVKSAAISDLRLEAAAVRIATEKLGYLGTPVEEKLQRVVADARAAAAELSAWLASPVLLAADGAHEAELRAAAEALGAALGASAALIDSIRRRDLGPLVEAVVRRDRAVRACSAALGVR
jgi:hypothetical protein